MSVIHNDLLLATDEATGYNLTKSLRFRASASAYLNRTPASTGNRKTWTYSVWFKRGALGGSTTKNLLTAYVGSGSSVDTIDLLNDNIRFFFNGSSSSYLVTSQVFRDPSAWYHLVAAVDTTQATAANRMKLYINGVQVTAFSSATYPTQNYDTFVNLASYPEIIGNSGFSSDYYDGYMTEAIMVDGQALTPSSFGETDTITGVWKPKRYSNTYGTNGFYLPFTDVATTSGSNAGLGKDFSGNGNYWTTNNISVTTGATYDSMTDVPTLTSATAANYCVLNPLSKGANVSATNGNLNAVISGGPAESLQSTLGMLSGKWYCEMTAGGGGSIFGITTVGANLGSWVGSDTKGYGYRGDTGAVMYNSSALVSGMSTFASGDVISLAFDADAGKLWFAKNGIFYNSGNPAAGTNATVSSITSGNWFVSVGRIAATNDAQFNFGQQGFTYTPPTGFKALNTYNLPDSTIVAGNKVMDATTYTGAGGTQNITNAAGFKPDFIWVKDRTDAFSSALFDSVRGFGATKGLVSNLTQAEGATSVQYGYISASNSNGFTVAPGNDSSLPNATTNVSGSAYVGWQWQAGQGTTSSNTSGSITSTVSVNASAGFSIVTYTGTQSAATVGHGLGVAPSMIIVRYTGASNWQIYHASVGNTGALKLNTTAATDTASSYWNNTSPTSTVFSVGTSDETNHNGGTTVAYCWSEIAGFSKFGSYVGNGSSDGPFVHLGFRPKYIMIKKTSSVEDWAIIDSTRTSYNIQAAELYADLSNAEYSNVAMDLLSNGIKLRTTLNTWNASGGSYIYMAFAENPFKNSLAR